MTDLQGSGYRAAYLSQAIEAMYCGEFSVGKRMLREYVKATIGFEGLGKAVGSPAKSLVCMLGESSNPRAAKIFEILKHLQEADRLEVRVVLMGKRSQRRRSGSGK